MVYLYKINRLLYFFYFFVLVVSFIKVLLKCILVGYVFLEFSLNFLLIIDGLIVYVYYIM